MISKNAVVLAVLIASTSLVHAQCTFFEVNSTPYDHQMVPVRQTLTTHTQYSTNRLSLSLINEWIIELRSMPYRYSRQWRTPSEVETARTGDCKGKAIALYERMQMNGARNLRFVIGKRRTTDSLTHSWLEWDTTLGTVLLDPTFNWTATMKTTDSHSYIAFYGYQGAHKYQAGSLLLAKRTVVKRNPVAPAHGVITGRIRTASRTQPISPLFNEAALESSFLFRRTMF